MPFGSVVMFAVGGLFVFFGIVLAEGWSDGFTATLAVACGMLALGSFQKGVHIWDEQAKEDEYYDKMRKDF